MKKNILILGLCMASLGVSAQRIVTQNPVINVGKTGFEIIPRRVLEVVTSSPSP